MGIDWNAGQDMDADSRMYLKVVELFNPADDEEFTAVLQRAADAIEAMDCQCRRSRLLADHVHVCRRCEALGREFDEKVQR